MMLASTAAALDTLDPLSTQALELTVTDPLAAGAAVTVATVTATLTRADGTAFTGTLASPVSLAHVGSGLYQALVAPSVFAASGLTLTTGRVIIDYTATVTGTNPLVVATVRQTVNVRRTVDA